MSEPAELTEPTPPTGLNRTAIAMATFFVVLIAFNIAFYVIALNNPVDLLPVPATAAAPADVAPRSP